MNLRAVFIGNVKFSAAALLKLIGMGITIEGIITKEKSTFNSDFYDLSSIANNYNIVYKYVNYINNNDTVRWLKYLKPDIIFCVGFSQIIKKEIIDIPPIGVVGYHPSALPANRGRHPLIWSLVLGLDETASTFFFMDEGADSGDILSQCPIEISEKDTATTLYQRMTKTALTQIGEFVPALASGNYQRIPQDHSKASYWRKRGKKDGQIDWRMSAKSIHNLVRGLTNPYVGAHFELEGNTIKVWETSVIENNEKNIEPGKILETDENGGTVVKTGENAIRLIKTEPVLDITQGSYL